MAIHDKFFTGSSVSRHTPVGEHSWGEIVPQSGKPITDADLIADQEIAQELQALLSRVSLPSGWIKGQARLSPVQEFSFPTPGGGGFFDNSFYMEKRTANVGGLPVVVEYANTTAKGFNRIVLDGPPVFGGGPPDVKRTDFVFLEVWQALISASPKATGTLTVTGNPTIPGDIIDIAGNALTAVAGAPAIDQFTIGGGPATTAANIAVAINGSPPNAFTNVTASASGSVVTIRAAVSGTAGNLLTIGQTGFGGDGVYTFSGATLSGGVDEPNKPTQDTIYRHGNVQAPGPVNLPDDIEDPLIGSETVKRTQIQYRIRATGQSEAVNFKTQADGFSNGFYAQGATGAPVVGYPFVPADGATISGSSSAVAWDTVDDGLWSAGDGSSVAAAALGTLDGFVYAIPLCFIFRRNDASLGAGWEPLSNSNGGLPNAHAIFPHPILGNIPVGESDRPDGAFVDAIVEGDILDLRRHVSLSGHDMKAELEFQMQSLLDGNFKTWAIDTADKQTLGGGSGDVSTQFLVCNQVGRSGGDGGVPPTSGDTTRGVTVRSFDHIARRFSDYAIVERIVFELFPTDDSGTFPGKFVDRPLYAAAYAGWAEGDEINIDLTALNATTQGDWGRVSPVTVAGGDVTDYWPPGTLITDVLSYRHDDGNYGAAVLQRLEPTTIVGVGTPHIQITLDANATAVNGGIPVATHRMVGDAGLDDGSARRVFVEVEITYPLGSGLTDTVDVEIVPDTTPYPDGPQLENDQGQRPLDWELLEQARFIQGKREVQVEYIANEIGSGIGSSTPITDNIISRNTTSLRFPRRVFGSGALLTGVTDVPGAAVKTVDTGTTEYGSSSRLVNLSGAPLSGAGQTRCDITYFAQDPIPNFGSPGGGYQIGFYYRSNAPQTAGAKNAPLSTMPDPLVVEPLVMGRSMWSGQVSSGSSDIPFPYISPLDQIAMNADVSEYPGEFYFAATNQISIDDFNADTGLLNLHSIVPADGTQQFSFSSADSDVEFRSHYKISDAASYRPTMFAQALSNVARHKAFFPFLARATEDSVLFRKNEVLLVVVSRFAELDDENTVRFTDTDNTTCAAIYRTRGLLLIAQ